VFRTLRGKGDKYNFPGYPADEQEKATQTVVEQAQLLALDYAAWVARHGVAIVNRA
jgi:hypothetical protein